MGQKKIICMFVCFLLHFIAFSLGLSTLVRDQAGGEVTESDSMVKKVFPQGPLAIYHVPENLKRFASLKINLYTYMGKWQC